MTAAILCPVCRQPAKPYVYQGRESVRPHTDTANNFCEGSHQPWRTAIITGGGL